jgi:hypothetical protein
MWTQLRRNFQAPAKCTPLRPHRDSDGRRRAPSGSFPTKNEPDGRDHADHAAKVSFARVDKFQQPPVTNSSSATRRALSHRLQDPRIRKPLMLVSGNGLTTFQHEDVGRCCRFCAVPRLARRLNAGQDDGPRHARLDRSAAPPRALHRNLKAESLPMLPVPGRAAPQGISAVRQSGPRSGASA